MPPTPTEAAHVIRYEPDERPPLVVSIALALQFAIPHVVGIVVVPTVVVRAAGGDAAFLSWTIFVTLAVGGISTALQAARVGRIGAGYILIAGASNSSIAVCVPALVAEGPALLATLVAVSALLQFVVAARLSLLRRIFTPTVSGTVIMLIPLAVMPNLLPLVTRVPDGAASLATLGTAAVTLVVTAAGLLLPAGVWRIWMPALGIATGCVVAAAVGIYDTSGVGEAGWIGLPAGSWPGLDLGFGRAFWILLPAFLFVSMAEALKTVGDGIGIQLVSWRKPRAVDFRAVQGAINANGVGTMLAGLGATMPSVPYSTVVPLVKMTGVAARRVGIAVGGVFLALAFLPRFMALVVALPDPVVGAYLAVLMATLFAIGVRVVASDRATHRKGIVAGVAFCVGAGFQNQLVFAEQLGPAWSGLLGNGIVTGGLAAMLMSLLLRQGRTRPRRIRTSLSVDSYPKIDAFLAEFCASRGWSDDMTGRLRAVGEEALITLTGRGDDEGGPETRRLVLAARNVGRAVELEFFASTDEKNLEDRMALIGSQVTEQRIEREISLRLLRHLASSVRHQQYHDTDIVTVRVDESD